MAVEATQALAAFVAGLKYQDLPERVREHTKNVLLDTLACAVAGPPGRGDRPGRTRWPRRWRSRGRSSVIGGDRAVARRRDHAQRLPDHRGDHVRHPPRHADPRHAGGGAAGARDRRARRTVGPRSAGRARRRLRGDDADRRRRRLAGDALEGLARPRRDRSVRCGRRGRPAAQASTPRRWRARSASPAASRPARSPPGARRR